MPNKDSCGCMIIQLSHSLFTASQLLDVVFMLKKTGKRFTVKVIDIVIMI